MPQRDLRLVTHTTQSLVIGLNVVSYVNDPAIGASHGKGPSEGTSSCENVDRSSQISALELVLNISLVAGESHPVW